jgi:hypothetical protein
MERANKLEAAIRTFEPSPFGLYLAIVVVPHNVASIAFFY